MHEPKLSDYGLDDATVAVIREKIAVIREKVDLLNKLKNQVGCVFLFLVHAIVIAALWPFFEVLSFLFYFPTAFLMSWLFWLGGSLQKTIFDNRESAIPGYNTLRRFESASRDYEQYREQAEMEERRGRARRELERKRQSREYWTSLSPRKFEYEVGELYKRHGYEAKVTPSSGDGGIDIILTKTAALRSSNASVTNTRLVLLQFESFME